ncbi:MAG: thioredoxin family protein [Chitinophagaceae bacterium]|nr:MAG: thioredoxin family protein [Chitinophagaceae bacterium]
MKKLGFSLFLAALVGLFAFTEVLPIGAPMPKAELKMADISGKKISLKDAAGANGLLVMFSCNTCPYVVKYQERTLESGNYALGKKIGVIVVNSNEGQRDSDDSFEAMQAYAKAQGYKWNYVVDKGSELADAFGANRTPECFLFDKAGKLVYHGAIDNNANDAQSASRKHLKEAMDELLSGKEVSVKETRSVGCTIKRVG